MIVLGHTVGFPWKGAPLPYDPEAGWSGSRLWIPNAKSLLLRDAGGEIGRPCDVYIAAPGFCPINRNPSAEDAKAAADLYGEESAGLKLRSLVLPPGRWQRMARVVGIDYTNADARSDGAPRDWGHPFSSPVWLYKHSIAHAWKVALPRFCLLDGRGFVRP